VPDILQTGHHAKIAAWRREKAEEITRKRRPDLWARYVARRGESLKDSSERKGKGQ
jgi:tRNA (guanine37-N1)-methyltransferase